MTLKRRFGLEQASRPNQNRPYSCRSELTLQDCKFADVYREFNPTVAKAIPEERLRAVWDAMNAQFGALKSIDERRSGELKGLLTPTLTPSPPNRWAKR